MTKHNIVKFNIRFNSGKDKAFAKVFVFDTQENMFKFYRLQESKWGLKEKGIGTNNDFMAMFQPFQIFKVNRDGTKKPKNWIGNFLFYKHGFGIGTVAHECGHAAIHWHQINSNYDGKKTIINSHDEEENMLYILGLLNYNFWKQYTKRQKEIEDM